MLKNINLKLKNFGPISSGDIDIGKINVVGGQNATGKSTASKILYSILRANSLNRKNLADKSLMNRIADLLLEINIVIREKSEFTQEDSVIKERILELMKNLTNAEGIDQLKQIFTEVKVLYNDLCFRYDFKKNIEETINEIDYLIEVAYNNPEKLYPSFMKRLINEEIGLTGPKGFASLTGLYGDNPFQYDVDLTKDFNFTPNEAFKAKGHFNIKQVFYIDSFSLLDLPQREGLQNTLHASALTRSLNVLEDESGDIFDNIYNDKIIKLEKEITDLMGGKFVYEKGKKLFFIKKDTHSSSVMKNTASGVKQLGIIQLLLSNRKLVEDSFLIIDEPEVNLHPRLQVELARILIKLSSVLNITLYINSHSPFFIEAMSVFAEYYDLLDETNFYLTEINSNGDYNFNKVEFENLHVIYDNLGESYDILDQIRLENEFGHKDE